ncbi:sushi domain protein [Dictyocaulus viviparus]|uniref:Sushi domain protein n=1 Tax=Dictyocaulus viviparus TaxID=29172 RepID=A0A0D8X8X6_DICVI|nr:sushi domain protein [Dictyocaulus viviparus]
MNFEIERCSATVAIWNRQINGSYSYRISDEDLSNEGYHRDHIDREDMIALLARSPGSCTLGPCTLELSTNIRNSDGKDKQYAILFHHNLNLKTSCGILFDNEVNPFCSGVISHQENVFGIPDGYTDIRDTFYCVRRHGDCGADRPIFRFTQGSGPSIVYAYSFDPTASFPGYSHEAKILCYGWTDSGSVVHRIFNNNSCVELKTTSANGKIIYSTSTSSIYSIGTTATLICDKGYMNGGQNTVLCTESGWYPIDGLSNCLSQNRGFSTDSLTIADESHFIPSSLMECTALDEMRNGQLIYSALATKGFFPEGTRATVLCDIGYHVFGSTNTVCQNGRWITKLGICDSKLDPKCPALQSPSGGTINYSTSEPFLPTTTATLVCDIGLVVSGVTTLQCTENGWIPYEGFGRCRNETSNISCSPVIISGGTASYVQSNPDVPYSSETSVFIKCEIGYTPVGSTSSICRNGIWTPSLGICATSSTFAKKLFLSRLIFSSIHVVVVEKAHLLKLIMSLYSSISSYHVTELLPETTLAN